MDAIKKLIGLINKKSLIKHTNLKIILTQHGMFKAKMYKHNGQEYIVIMSHNFSEIKAPIFYIHTDEHACDSLDEFCGCSYPISVALKMIHKDGGLILYSSNDINNIDALLREMKVQKFQSTSQVMLDTNLTSSFKGYRGEYLTIDFILKDLKISNVQLVSDNPNIIFIIRQRGINIVKQVSSIAFEYGNNKSFPVNETIETAKEISFEYPNKN
jgi:GTP cyclohydrolase II